MWCVTISYKFSQMIKEHNTVYIFETHFQRGNDVDPIGIQKIVPLC